MLYFSVSFHCDAIFHCFAMHCTVFYDIALQCFVLCSVTLHCSPIVMHCFVLNCILCISGTRSNSVICIIMCINFNDNGSYDDHLRSNDVTVY